MSQPVIETSKDIIINIDKELILAYLKILVEEDYKHRNQA